MIGSPYNRSLLYCIICGLVGLYSLTGCTPHNYKAEADEQVYGIIDQKWRDDFGPRANYRISDAQRCPN
jgi:hypothetical protein